MESIFQSRLREARKEKKLTQGELGTLLGVEKSTISKYEVGTNSVDVETLVKLCIKLDVSADYLLGLSDHPGRWPGSKLETDLLRAYKAASEKDKAIVNAALEISLEASSGTAAAS